MNEEKRVNWVLITLLVVFILGLFSLYLYQKNRYKSVYFEYNGFAVHKGVDKAGNIIYQTKLFVGDNTQPYLITTRYNPKDIEDIEVYNDLKGDLLKKEIYITMDSSSTAVSVLAATEISKITGNSLLYNIPTSGAFTSCIEGYDWPIKTCNDVTEDQAIISLKQSDKSRIYSQNNCVIIEGKDEYDLIRVTNRLIFTLLGIMEV